jgi:hypothetical protein
MLADCFLWDTPQSHYVLIGPNKCHADHAFPMLDHLIKDDNFIYGTGTRVYCIHTDMVCVQFYTMGSMYTLPVKSWAEHGYIAFYS